MTDHSTHRRIMRQRERKATKAEARATVAAYNREGMDGITEALGAGSADHWDEEQGDE